MVRVRKITPNAANEEKQITQEENWPATPDDGHGIGEETRDTDYEDTPTEATIEGVVRDAKLLSHDTITRGNHRTLDIALPVTIHSWAE